MEFMGYVRPDGTVGIRNNLCFLSLDAESDFICRQLSVTINGTVMLPYHYENKFKLDENADLISAIAGNPNVGAVIMIESLNENLLSKYIFKKIAEKGKLVKIINIHDCGGIAGAFAKALTTAVLVMKDITTYRRELVKLKNLSVGIWLEKDVPEDLRLTFASCLQNLLEHGCSVVGNNSVEKVLLIKGQNGDKKDSSLNLSQVLPNNTTQRSKFVLANQKKEFELLAAIAGSQILVQSIPATETSILNLILPTIKITFDNKYYEVMEDAVDFYIGVGSFDPKAESLLLVNEILSTCSGKITKAEIMRGFYFKS
ncbi:MAG: UxaA family hydrolase [Nitrososphaerota archaeon]